VAEFNKQILINYHCSQKIPLLDEEITDQLQSLELTGTPSASLPAELADFPHSSEAVELCCDSNLRVTLQKVWKPRELVLVLYLTNQNQAGAPIHDVISVLEPPSNLIGLFDFSSINNLQDDIIGALEWVRTFSYMTFVCFAFLCPGSCTVIKRGKIQAMKCLCVPFFSTVWGQLDQSLSL